MLLYSYSQGQTATSFDKKDTTINKSSFRGRPALCSDLTVNYLPFLNKNLFGFGWTVEVRFGKRFFTGGNIELYSNCNLNSSYGYTTNKPKGNYGDILWINEFRIIDKKIVKINLFVSNGFAIIDLKDGEHTHYFDFTHVYNSLAKNYYYSLQPGFNMMFDVFGKKRNAKLFIKANYHFMFGNSSFSKASDFDTFSFSIGLRGELL
jgi:hypothetical protein